MFHVVDNLTFGMLCDDYFLKCVAVTSFGFHFVMLYDVLIYECYRNFSKLPFFTSTNPRLLMKIL